VAAYVGAQVSKHTHDWQVVGYTDKPWYTWKYFGWAIARCAECGAYERMELANGDEYPVKHTPCPEFVGPLIPPTVIYDDAWQALA
jgi:hypothetical protein